MTKRHITIATFCALLLFVFLANISVNSAHTQKGINGTTAAPPAIELVSPRSGDLLVPGQMVKVQWKILNPDKDANVDWCEQEIYISLDGGTTASGRISPQLDPRATTFDWVVPNTPTKTAVLDIRIGCEGGAPYPETSRVQSSVVFQIRPSLPGLQMVRIASAESEVVNPGGQINLNWESSVEAVKTFDVMVSYDAGAHYSRVGRTKETSFSFKVPDDYAGSLTFQVVARKTDGTSVASDVDLRNRILVKSLE